MEGSKLLHWHERDKRQVPEKQREPEAVCEDLCLVVLVGYVSNIWIFTDSCFMTELLSFHLEVRSP